MRGKHQHPTGVGILEMIITIGIVSTLLIVVLSIRNVVQLQQSSYNRTVARQLIVEESESLRNASFADLHNRTNTSFIEVAYNIGDWSIQQPSTPQSGVNVYRVQNVTGAFNPSKQVVPTGTLSDGTYEMYFRAQPASPVGWKMGMYVRYHDDQNYYLLQIRESQLIFTRVIEGVSTQLWSTSRTFNTNVWYRITVAITGEDFTISVGGAQQSGTPFTDAGPTFSRGYFVLGAFDGVIADIDNVSFTGTGTASWNFDGAGETVMKHADGWRRLGPSGLPSGATSISISDAVSGFTDLRRVDLSVSWQERAGTRSLSNTFYINQQSVAP